MLSCFFAHFVSSAAKYTIALKINASRRDETIGDFSIIAVRQISELIDTEIAL